MGEIRIAGAKPLTEKTLKRKMRNVKERAWWRIFKASKFLEEEFNADLEALVAYYREKGYRNARVAQDSLYRTAEGELGIAMSVEEGGTIPPPARSRSPATPSTRRASLTACWA